MFERLTDCARKAMAWANQEAQRSNDHYIGPEHILLGLVTDAQSVGARVLTNLGTDLKRLRQEVKQRMKERPPAVTMGTLPQTKSAKKVIEQAIVAARSLDHNYVGSEHLLLGLLRVHDDIAFAALSELDIDEDSVCKEVVALVGPGGANRPDTGFSDTRPPAPDDIVSIRLLGERITELEAAVDLWAEEIRKLRRRMEEG